MARLELMTYMMSESIAFQFDLNLMRPKALVINLQKMSCLSAAVRICEDSETVYVLITGYAICQRPGSLQETQKDQRRIFEKIICTCVTVTLHPL